MNILRRNFARSLAMGAAALMILGPRAAAESSPADAPSSAPASEAPATAAATAPAATAAAPAASPSRPALPFWTAAITYTCSGMTRGTETLYIDAKSNRLAIDTAVTKQFHGLTSEDSSRVIFDGTNAYAIKAGRSDVVKIPTAIGGDIITAFFGATPAQAPTGRQLVARQPCESYSNAAGSVCLWHGIPLLEIVDKHPLGQGFNSRKEASSIQLDAPLPAGIFDLPKGATVITAEEVMNKLGDTLAQIQQRMGQPAH